MFRHLVRTQQFNRETLKKLFTLATSLEGTREESLHEKILASVFYEPSTRTRFSFESAMYRLGGHVLTTENAREFSSAAKGETLEDAIRVMGYYADVIVLRHPEIGAAERAAAVSNVPVINAGDGAGQHPTQALLDLYTIEREQGKVDGVHVAIVGDLKNGRAARSLAYLLGKYKDVRITLVSPPGLRIKNDIKQYLKRHAVVFDETEKLEPAMKKVDVVYQTRVQQERFTTPQEYEQFKGYYVIDRALANSMKKGAIIIHPLPRVGEIALEVDDSPHAVYFRQVGYGLLVRMALLKTLLYGEEKQPRKRRA
ncbi:aspartate carbamoyltransferase [Candidatus Kaiserbacteria bacterium RIFCSPLOWO2_01_FULL_53_17]|uniref:Aspartate carbamoyltransferase n=1 Tax=Candidatus Kaiserbacteria bacterium RIFCSPLOWO2_01_FULL_53_17 TaxID=1798511 RepID=A0A1F6EHN5_9BACT|nr:MAG: aspartate carbamoyltransferase [Candidatus Kaiserbacteria bacterium RIFCSPLOWO2_01_FULL_53_17]